MAFEDTWTWSPILYEEFMQDIRNARLFDLMESLHKILGASEMMAVYPDDGAKAGAALRRTLARHRIAMVTLRSGSESLLLKVVLDVLYLARAASEMRSYGSDHTGTAT